jgi:hypothetical protein
MTANQEGTVLSRRRLCGLALPGLAFGLRPDRLSALTQSQSPKRTKVFIWKHGGSKGCCGPWAAELVDAGFNVEVEQVIHSNKLRQEFQIPRDLWSCHTAVIEAYIMEGHVPIADIQRLLDERPYLNGLCAPDYLDEEGYLRTEGTYDVIAFRGDGSREVFSTNEIET